MTVWDFNALGDTLQRVKRQRPKMKFCFLKDTDTETESCG